MQVLQEQLEIGSDPTEVGRARRWARSRLAGAGVDADESLAETLILLISELVTNAVVHTGCPAVLCMLLPRQQGRSGQYGPTGPVRVEVADASGRPPLRRQAEGEDTNGRGLELISGLADRWGWEPEAGGKRVWCELDPVPPVPAAPSAVPPPPAAGHEFGVGVSGRTPAASTRAGGTRAMGPDLTCGVPMLPEALRLGAFG